MTDKQKRFARNVAIGAVVTAAVLGTAYMGYKYKSSQSGEKILKAFDKSLDLRGKELEAKLPEVPVDALSDDDIILKRGTKSFQRIVVGTSKVNALMQEKTSDIMYATYSEKDNNFYKSVFARII